MALTKITPAFNAETRTIVIRKEIENNPFELNFREIDWYIINETIRLLIKGRIQHCEDELAKATIASETMFDNSISQQIFFKNGGHFSIPVYNQMVEWYNSGQNLQDASALITQQALRHYFYLLRTEDTEALTELENALISGSYTLEDLENILTEDILIK